MPALSWSNFLNSKPSVGNRPVVTGDGYRAPSIPSSTTYDVDRTIHAEGDTPANAQEGVAAPGDTVIPVPAATPAALLNYTLKRFFEEQRVASASDVVVRTQASQYSEVTKQLTTTWVVSVTVDVDSANPTPNDVVEPNFTYT